MSTARRAGSAACAGLAVPQSAGQAGDLCPRSLSMDEAIRAAGRHLARSRLRELSELASLLRRSGPKDALGDLIQPSQQL